MFGLMFGIMAGVAVSIYRFGILPYHVFLFIGLGVYALYALFGPRDFNRRGSRWESW